MQKSLRTRPRGAHRKPKGTTGSAKAVPHTLTSNAYKLCVWVFWDHTKIICAYANGPSYATNHAHASLGTVTALGRRHAVIHGFGTRTVHIIYVGNHEMRHTRLQEMFILMPACMYECLLMQVCLSVCANVFLRSHKHPRVHTFTYLYIYLSLYI